MTTTPGRATDVRRELQAHLDALNELGPQYTDTVAASFMERLDRMIDQKIEARLARLQTGRARIQREQTGTIAVTMALGIPLTAIAGGIAGLGGIAAVSIALVVIIFMPRPR